MAEFVAQEEMGRMTGYWWAPDESKIAFTKVDESPVEVIKRSEIYADSIKMIEQRYPSTGTDNVVIELAIQDLKTGKRQWINLGDEKDIYLPRFNGVKITLFVLSMAEPRSANTQAHALRYQEKPVGR